MILRHFFALTLLTFIPALIGGSYTAHYVVAATTSVSDKPATPFTQNNPSPAPAAPATKNEADTAKDPDKFFHTQPPKPSLYKDPN